MFGVDATKPAGQAWYDSILRLYAGWGVDFIKVDDLSRPYSTAEIEAIHRAIEKCGRSIVFSTSPGETPVTSAAHISAQANMWRMSDDFWDNWKFIDHNLDLMLAWRGVAGPGHWPDADMIPLGKIGKRSVGKSRWTAFTRDEQITLMSLWAVVSSPLMLGMNLPENDDWTTALLSNPEVLAVNQDPLGKAAVRVAVDNKIEVWSKTLTDGSQAVALINRGNASDIDEARAIFKSPLVTRSSPGPINIDLDITGAKKLWLVVDDGGQLRLRPRRLAGTENFYGRRREETYEPKMEIRHGGLAETACQPQRQRRCAHRCGRDECRRHWHTRTLGHRI